MIMYGEPSITIENKENPIYIWNMKELTDYEKRILYNMYILLVLNIQDWNNPINIAKVCNIDEELITLKLEDLTNRGYLRINFSQFWFAGKFFDALEKVSR